MISEKNPKTRQIARMLLRLEDKLRGKPFPKMARVKEISNYSCGPATLEMLLSFAKVRKSQTGMIKTLRVQNTIKLYGITPKDMAKATNAAGKGKLAFWKKQKAMITDISQAINKYNYPVGVEWQGDFFEQEDEDKGHYAVVTKIDRKVGHMRIADPYFNTFFHYEDLDRKMEISSFTKLWWDVNEVKVDGSTNRRKVKDIRLMFVITPKGELWPKKLGMKKV